MFVYVAFARRGDCTLQVTAFMEVCMHAGTLTANGFTTRQTCKKTNIEFTNNVANSTV